MQSALQITQKRKHCDRYLYNIVMLLNIDQRHLQRVADSWNILEVLVGIRVLPIQPIPIENRKIGGWVQHTATLKCLWCAKESNQIKHHPFFALSNISLFYSTIFLLSVFNFSIETSMIGLTMAPFSFHFSTFKLSNRFHFSSEFAARSENPNFKYMRQVGLISQYEGKYPPHSIFSTLFQQCGRDFEKKQMKMEKKNKESFR